MVKIDALDMRKVEAGKFEINSLESSAVGYTNNNNNIAKCLRVIQSKFSLGTAITKILNVGIFVIELGENNVTIPFLAPMGVYYKGLLGLNIDLGYTGPRVV